MVVSSELERDGNGERKRRGSEMTSGGRKGKREERDGEGSKTLPVRQTQ